jgi:cell division protein ZapA (FtsZ GTPase activity inhibitor)
LELTPEQKTKIDAAAKEFNDAMATLKKEGLTPALSKKQADAMKAARDAGKKGPTLADDVLASLDITDEQKGLLKKAREIQAKMQKNLAAALTETQIAGLPQGAKTTLKRAASEGKKSKK